MFGFTAGLAVAACLLFGLTPALRATATDPGAAIKAGSRGSTDPRERFTVRRSLVVVQVALSLVLVVGAVLFGRSLRNLTTLDPGFRQENLLVVNMDLRRAGVPAAQRPLLYERIVARLAGLPGVSSASQAGILPVSGSVWNERIILGGATQQTLVNFNNVGANYFQTMGMPLSRGRDFSVADSSSSPKVAVVNELFVQTFFSGQSPIGKSFQVESGPGQPQRSFEIIGVVRDAAYTDLRAAIPAQAFLAASQDADPDPFLQGVLRTTLPASSVSAAATAAIREIHPAILLRFSTLEQSIRNSLTTERLMATLSGFFGVLAMMIATIGLYGVMSYMVARRRIEIGIRMALGANRRRRRPDDRARSGGPSGGRTAARRRPRGGGWIWCCHPALRDQAIRSRSAGDRPGRTESGGGAGQLDPRAARGAARADCRAETRLTSSVSAGSRLRARGSRARAAVRRQQLVE